MRDTHIEAPTPKLLPWLARRAGIGLERAEELWRQAVLESGDGHVAMPSFRRSLEQERRQGVNVLAPWMDIQDRMWRATPLLLADSLVHAARRAARFWHRAARLAA